MSRENNGARLAAGPPARRGHHRTWRHGPGPTCPRCPQGGRCGGQDLAPPGHGRGAFAQAGIPGVSGSGPPEPGGALRAVLVAGTGGPSGRPPRSCGTRLVLEGPGHRACPGLESDRPDQAVALHRHGRGDASRRQGDQSGRTDRRERSVLAAPGYDPARRSCRSEGPRGLPRESAQGRVQARRPPASRTTAGAGSRDRGIGHPRDPRREGMGLVGVHDGSDQPRSPPQGAGPVGPCPGQGDPGEPGDDDGREGGPGDCRRRAAPGGTQGRFPRCLRQRSGQQGRVPDRGRTGRQDHRPKAPGHGLVPGRYPAGPRVADPGGQTCPQPCRDRKGGRATHLPARPGQQGAPRDLGTRHPGLCRCCRHSPSRALRRVQTGQPRQGPTLPVRDRRQPPGGRDQALGGRRRGGEGETTLGGQRDFASGLPPVHRHGA